MTATTIEIRLLGDWGVRRHDGCLIDNHDWRTGKTRDLLRLLALDNGHAVRSPALIAKLWPDASPDRARASLRTAASQIRHAMGVNCIERQPGHLVLRGCWVDVGEFVSVHHQSQRAALRRDPYSVIALAEAGERLYRGDFHAYDDDSDWASLQRNLLIDARHQMLTDAAQSSVELGQFRQAIEFATLAIRANPSSEGPHRSLMTAYAELGEVGSALRVFESYRTRLAEELGADPSPQATQLHLSLLRGAVR
ncbi:MAG TPA: bacterial transcriptional activator domain-containing protein [Nocardioides sp.]|nr:bacterial transcriptional activator domain-containing protein [Nocardioides sp.]